MCSCMYFLLCSHSLSVCLYLVILVCLCGEIVSKYHGLRGSASPVLTASGFDNERGQFSTTTESTPLDRSPKNLLPVITSATPTAVPNLVQICPRGLLGEWVKYNENFFVIYLFIPFFGSSQVRPVDGFSRLMAQTTRTRARVCLLGDSLMLLPILEVKSPTNSNFLVVNRHFQAKRANILKVSYYQNYFIDVNQILHNNRDHRVVIVGGPNMRQTNPRWRTAAILEKKPVKSPYLCNRLTDFDKIWHGDSH